MAALPFVWRKAVALLSPAAIAAAGSAERLLASVPSASWISYSLDRDDARDGSLSAADVKHSLQGCVFWICDGAASPVVLVTAGPQRGAMWVCACRDDVGTFLHPMTMRDVKSQRMAPAPSLT